jgi:phytoene desaturase
VRTVTGRTDHVVVVGAGLGGLSAALHLAGAGRQVTVVERGLVAGGRMGLLERDGYRLDTGPTVLTMPGIVAGTLAAVGEDLPAWLELRAVEPLYRAFFADGSVLDVHADPERMADEVAAVCGPREAAGYRSYVRVVTELYRAEMDDFIDRNVDSPLDLLRPALGKLVALGGFRRLAPTVARHLHDPRTQRVFSFQSMYAGLSPYQALALYGVVSYMDTVAGVHFPVGGMHAVPRALAAAATAHGVKLRYGCEVESVELSGRRAVAVVTTDGERVACDALVLNPDLPVAYGDLLGREPWTVRRLRYSPSCFLLLAGSRAAYSRTAHHSIHFGRAWRTVFSDLVDDGRLMADPSFLVSNPTRTDPSLAPQGRQAYSVLFPTPNLTASVDWRSAGPRYRDEVLRTLEQRGYAGFADGIEVEHVTTPADWLALGMARGTPFAAAHTLTQTGPFRPRNRWGENVVFAGSGTTPGVGVPMALLSGRLAAERVTGPVPRRRSRALP